MSTKAQRLKWRIAKRASVAAQREAGVVPGRKPRASGGQREAIIYLRHAERALTRELRAGKTKKLSRSGLLMLLALDALQGGE